MLKCMHSDHANMCYMCTCSLSQACAGVKPILMIHFNQWLKPSIEVSTLQSPLQKTDTLTVKQKNSEKKENPYIEIKENVNKRITTSKMGKAKKRKKENQITATKHSHQRLDLKISALSSLRKLFKIISDCENKINFWTLKLFIINILSIIPILWRRSVSHFSKLDWLNSRFVHLFTFIKKKKKSALLQCGLYFIVHHSHQLWWHWTQSHHWYLGTWQNGYNKVWQGKK